jgi:chemotaxis protein MotB
MGIMNRFGYLILSLTVGLSAGCASQRKYQELQDAMNQAARESLRADSLQEAARISMEERREMEIQYGNLLHEMEKYRAANLSLYESYRDMQERFTRSVEQGQGMLATSSYEKATLTDQLAMHKEELDRREQYLRNLEQELARREELMGLMQNQDTRQEILRRDQLIQQLQAQLRQKESTLQKIRQELSQIMQGFSQSDLSLRERRGRLYVTMSQNLLFRSGSNDIGPNGKRAIQQVAAALRGNPDIDIVVEGHTDTDGRPLQNWNLSALRATAVVQELVAAGVDPHRVTAAGRAFYDPVAPNTTEADKALNRRTEIIISPRLEELMDLLNR